MKIKLKDINIESDANQFVLSRDRESNTGKKYNERFAFYSTIESAIEGCLRHTLLGSEATTLKEMADEIREFKKIFKNSLGI